MRELAYVFDFVLVIYAFFELHATIFIFTENWLRIFFGIISFLTLTTTIFSIKFHESTNLRKKESFLRVYFLAGAILFNLQMALCFHNYFLAKADYQSSACEFCFENIEPFAKRIEENNLLLCNRRISTGREKRSHREHHVDRRKHLIPPPENSANYEFFALKHFMEKVEDHLFNEEYDLCKDEKLTDGDNDEKLKAKVFSAILESSDNCQIAKINGEDYASLEALHHCAFPPETVKEPHISILVDFYTAKFASSNISDRILDEKAFLISTVAIYSFYLKSVFITIAMCFHYFPVQNQKQ
ncbi:Oidioi.mRNA.OKI2018_I69.chr2.g4711.t1.cds [Oikopleura dioica]|uniref:Oidioi.mRNA.OKI2018_I69.chr2.g4711.t1.cds n=1 Tax=Oikopleura dioica TaxID=34765 RepID=A0ABN7T1Y9_OIKDI|nr:Oidioi.mRNA.OKI2018_I69.chr2.g4711.t1.cds [Oikopleura dioica]